MRSPIFLAPQRTVTPSKIAASYTTVGVSSRISELRPPMTPATAMPPSLSAITSIELSSVRSTSSSVVSFSPSCARRTVISRPRMVRMSNACIGWPYSSIT